MAHPETLLPSIAHAPVKAGRAVLRPNGPADALQLGFLKATLVHRHAFIGDLSRTLILASAARVPASFSEGLCVWTPEQDAAGAAFSKAAAARRWSAAQRSLESWRRKAPRDLFPKVMGGLLRQCAQKKTSRGGSPIEGMLERYAHPQALARLRRAVVEFPQSAPAHVWLALVALRRCEFKEARQVLDALVRLSPRWSWAYLLRSEWGRVDISFEGSLADLDRAAQLDPSNAWVYAFRSRVLFQKDPKPEALADLDRAVALDPESGWIRAWRGDARRKLGDLRGALEDLSRAAALEPSYDRTYLWLAKTLAALGEDRRAVLALERGIALCPHFEKAYAQRSQALRRLGRVEEAVRDLNRAVRVNHRHDWLGNWTVETYPLTPQHEASLAAIADASRRRPRSAWLRAWHGEALVQAGRLEEGLAELDAALRLSPLAWAFAWRGEAHLRAGRRREASADLARALHADPQYGRAYAWRGRLHYLEGRYARAVRDLERAVSDSYVEYSWPYYWKAQALWKLGDTDAARDDAATAVALEPRRPEFFVFARSIGAPAAGAPPA